MNSEQSIEQALRDILERFDSGEADQARDGIRSLTEYLERIPSESKQFENRVSNLLGTLSKARYEGERGAGFQVQSGLDDWLQTRPQKTE